MEYAKLDDLQVFLVPNKKCPQDKETKTSVRTVEKSFNATAKLGAPDLVRLHPTVHL